MTTASSIVTPQVKNSKYQVLLEALQSYGERSDLVKDEAKGVEKRERKEIIKRELERRGLIKPDGTWLKKAAESIDPPSRRLTGNPEKDYPGFDWKKILRGDASKLLYASTEPGRWQTTTPHAEAQGRYCVGNEKNQNNALHRTYIYPEKPLMSTTVDSST